MIWSGWRDYPCTPLDADLHPMGEGRPEGLHLGTIIQRMRMAAGERCGDIEGDQPNVRMAEGFLWEIALEYVASGMSMDEAIELAFKRYMTAINKDVAKQVRLLKDDIHMTPDGVNYSIGEAYSYKATRKKIPATQDIFESKFWTWLIQEKSYLHALSMDTVHWIVLFQAGDYSKGPGTGPRMLISTGVFEPKELVDNWANVLHHAAQFRKQ